MITLSSKPIEDISQNRIIKLHPSIRDATFRAYAKAVRITPKGVHPFILETVRSFERSEYLYKLGRTIVNLDGKSEKRPMGNIVTMAQAGSSYHNYGLALDVCNQINGVISYKVDKNFMLVVDCFKEEGFEWGGNFSSFVDYPHMQKRLGKTWKQLLILHNERKVDKDGYVIL